MRKEFKYYNRLTRLETGISTDPVRNIISASKEWWDEKIKINLDYRPASPEPDILRGFIRDTAAVGDKAKVPCEFGDGSTPDDVQFVDITDGKEDTDEVRFFDDVDSFLTYDSSSKKRRGKKLTPKRDNKRNFEGKNEGKSEGKIAQEESCNPRNDEGYDDDIEPHDEVSSGQHRNDDMYMSAVRDTITGQIFSMSNTRARNDV
ncbi:unnamed protein product [Lactuca saligna]|uniref:Uncharacterized protein n=1 Tax=Lactuca saligna TaxID=75948 RepID=A0AA35YPA2_LACSI|nr:unnamed protein product [Lactuca saligna]